MNVDELVNEIYFPSPANSQSAATLNRSQTQNSTQPPSLQKISADHQPNTINQQLLPSQLQPQKATLQPATKSKSISNYIPKFAQTTVKVKEFYAQHRLKVIIMLIVLVFIIIIYGSYKTNGGLYKKLSGISFLSKILPKKAPLALPPPTAANMNPTTNIPALLPPTSQSPPIADKQESKNNKEDDAEDVDNADNAEDDTEDVDDVEDVNDAEKSKANKSQQQQQQQQSAPVTKSPKKKAAAQVAPRNAVGSQAAVPAVSTVPPTVPPPSKKKKRAQATSLMPVKLPKQVAPTPVEPPKTQYLTNKEILESETNKKKLPLGEDSDAYYE